MDLYGYVSSKFRKEEGLKCWYHNVAIDNKEHIYVTDILGNKIQKFEKIRQMELNKIDRRFDI